MHSRLYEGIVRHRRIGPPSHEFCNSLFLLYWILKKSNPVSFYFCYDSSGHSVDAVVAEVNNTPWGERHCYVIDGRPSLTTPREPVSICSAACRRGGNQ